MQICVSWDVPMCTCVETLVIPTTVYSEILVGCPSLLMNYEESGVTHSIYVRDDGLEFVAMFKYGYPNINIRKYVLKQ